MRCPEHFSSMQISYCPQKNNRKKTENMFSVWSVPEGNFLCRFPVNFCRGIESSLSRNITDWHSCMNRSAVNDWNPQNFILILFIYLEYIAYKSIKLKLKYSVECKNLDFWSKLLRNRKSKEKSICQLFSDRNYRLTVLVSDCHEHRQSLFHVL